jgi:hypothetical protein
MFAKYSDFLCIWLRKCDFLTGKVRYWPDPDPKLFIPDPDPQHWFLGSVNIPFGSGSADPLSCFIDPDTGGQLITGPAEFGSYLDIFVAIFVVE